MYSSIIKTQMTFTLAIFALRASNWIVKGNNDYEVVHKNVTKSNNNPHSVSALTVSRAIADFGKTFHYGMIGELNKVTEVDGKKKVGFLMKRLPFIKHIPSLAGFFGGVGTLLSLIFSVIPKGESPELRYMKESFSKVNKKLDVITNSLKETKNLVKEYTQKAAYIRAEKDIIQAYGKVELAVSDILKLSCSGKEDCKIKKMKLVDDIIDKLNVRGDLEMVFQGVTQSSVFGVPLLDLITENVRCDIRKIEVFVSSVAGLLAKGAAAATFYDIFKRNNYVLADDLKQFQSLMLNLEKKKEATISNCYKIIDTYIKSDAYEQIHNSFGTIHETNKRIVDFLSVKYHWIPFYVVTIKSNKIPLYWTNEIVQREMNSKDDEKEGNVKSFIFIGSHNRVANHDRKIDRFRSKLKTDRLTYYEWFTHKFDKAIDKFHKSMKNDEFLHNQFRAFLIVPEYEDIVIGYRGVDDSLKQISPVHYKEIKRNDLMVYHQCRKNLVCGAGERPVHVIATIKSIDSKIFDCKKQCSVYGRCFFMPHSKTMGCKCDPQHYGEVCNMSISDFKMAADLGKLLDISFKIPSLLDVSVQLKGVHVALQSDIGNIKNTILAMDKKLNNIFGTLNKELMTSFDWHGLITQYGQIVRDLKYYYHILIEKDDLCRQPKLLDILNLKCDLQKKFITEEKKELAKAILKPNELRRHLHLLSYLFFGRQDVPLVSHKPLLFQTMDKNRQKLCSAEYKNILDKSYKQLLLLQFQGYVVWIHALKYLDFDTGFVVERYKGLIQRQRNFYDSNTCNVTVKHSVNFKNCSNGYYLYSGMKEEVKCVDKFYIKKETSFGLFVNAVTRVSSELSKTRSSAKMIIGPPNVYPSYGENSNAWSPSTDKLTELQFIEVSFKDPMFIKQILIYETLNGGAVEKIEGFNKDGKWKILWETQKSELKHIKESRLFAIPLTPGWSTSRLRVSIDPTVARHAFQIDAIQIKGRPVEGTCTWYNSLSCVACNCDATGSSNMQCSTDGKCSCNTGFEGKTCDTKHCIMGEWSAWSRCECGPGKTKIRHRSVTQTQYGKGRACEGRSQTDECNISCVCNDGDWGDYCERKNCLVSSWGAWEGCPHQERHTCGESPVINHVYRHRHVTRRNQNGGHACPGLRERKACPVPPCKHNYSPYGR